MILYLAIVVEINHRFVIYYLDRTRDFISQPPPKNITDSVLFEHESRDFEALTLCGTNFCSTPISMRLRVLGFFGTLITFCCQIFEIPNGEPNMADAKVQIQPIFVKLNI